MDLKLTPSLTAWEILQPSYPTDQTTCGNCTLQATDILLAEYCCANINCQSGFCQCNADSTSGTCALAPASYTAIQAGWFNNGYSGCYGGASKVAAGSLAYVTSTSQCVSGFAELYEATYWNYGINCNYANCPGGHRCIKPAYASVGDTCMTSAFPSCNCIDGVCH
jgi:hypothetical protein